MVLSSGALFAYHCAQGQLALAALHPVALYSALLLLLLLPVDFVFRVSDPLGLAHAAGYGCEGAWNSGCSMHSAVGCARTP